MNYLNELKRKYDVKDFVETKIQIPNLPTNGLILIVGSSGSGKSTILKKLGNLDYLNKIDYNKSVIENFTNPIRGEELLLSCGLRSIPTWFRSPKTLSNGEFHRFETAFALDNNENCIDEFTSVVDRDTAKSLASSIKNYFDKNNGVLYVASCHRDIIEWLQPNYIYDTDLMRFEQRSLLWRRPQLHISIRSADYSYWDFFKKYHYLDSTMSKATHCYVAFIEKKPIAFASIIHGTSWQIPSYWRESRVVVLPEFQGFGIGTKFTDEIAQFYKSKGFRYFSKTAHPNLGEHREKSVLWKPTTQNKKIRKDYLNKDGTVRNNEHWKGKTLVRDSQRTCYSHEYIGEKYGMV